MRSRPILMNAFSMQAILAGRKLQTRRIVKPQPNRHQTNDGRLEVRGNKLWWAGLSFNPTKPFATCPYGIPGNLLWCKESWACASDVDEYAPCNICESLRAPIWYKCESDAPEHGRGRWRRSIFMPRWASRVTLEVVNVKVERVQAISEDDARAEGARHITPSAILHKFNRVSVMGYRAGFREIWDSIHANPKSVKKSGKIHRYASYPWDGETCVEEHRGLPHYIYPNPWCWCIKFKVVKCG